MEFSKTILDWCREDWTKYLLKRESLSREELNKLDLEELQERFERCVGACIIDVDIGNTMESDPGRYGIHVSR